MTNKEIAEYTLNALKSSGAQAAQCFVFRGRTDELNVDSGEFSLMRSLFNTSLSMKALVDGKKGVMAINTLDKESIGEAVKGCITAAQSSVADDAEKIAEFFEYRKFETGVFEADMEKLYRRVEELITTVKKEYPKTRLEQLISQHNGGEVLYMNSNGTVFEHKTGSYQLSTMFSANDGENASSFYSYGMQMDNLDTALIEHGMLKRLFSESEKQINAQAFNGKFTGTLLITPGCLVDIISSLLSNTVFDTVLIEGTSEWKNKLGKQVASSSLSVSSQPYNEQIVGGERFTSDGYVSENFDIIKDGVLKSFVLSQYGAIKTGKEMAKNSGGNICIAPGDKSLEQLIGGVEKGVLLNRFSGGNPSTNGDFSGVAKNSFLIENGEIKQALSETMVSGNLMEMINNISGVSKETISDGFTVTPWIAFEGVTISGK